MKIIALLPVKNEAWILSAYLSSVTKVADEIIALDDGSVDLTKEVLRSFGVVIEDFNQPENVQMPMSLRRKLLLKLGRLRGGTHFIWLDADEAFTAPFIKEGLQYISKLKPGQKLSMQWLTLWKNHTKYRDDLSVWSNNFKDFIVCDDSKYDFEDKFFSEGRTQGPNNDKTLIRLDPKYGAVLHFQFVPWNRFQMKQAWYRCRELVNLPDAVDSINQAYSITFDDSSAQLKDIPSDWLRDIVIPPNITSEETSWHKDEIFKLFDSFGTLFFEKLQIWHIEELNSDFVFREGRQPRREVSISFKWNDFKSNLKKIARKTYNFLDIR